MYDQRPIKWRDAMVIPGRLDFISGVHAGVSLRWLSQDDSHVYVIDDVTTPEKIVKLPLVLEKRQYRLVSAPKPTPLSHIVQGAALEHLGPGLQSFVDGVDLGVGSAIRANASGQTVLVRYVGDLAYNAEAFFTVAHALGFGAAVPVAVALPNPETDAIVLVEEHFLGFEPTPPLGLSEAVGLGLLDFVCGNANRSALDFGLVNGALKLIHNTHTFNFIDRGFHPAYLSDEALAAPVPEALAHKFLALPQGELSRAFMGTQLDVGVVGAVADRLAELKGALEAGVALGDIYGA